MKKTTNNTKLISILVLAGLIGGVSYWQLNKSTPVETSEIKTPVAITTPITETALARIDFSVKTDAETTPFIVSEGENQLKSADWMTKWGSRGYVYQKEGADATLKLNATEECDIIISLKGPAPKIINEERIGQWVDFTSLTVNGQEVLADRTPAWHDKPFKHTIHANAGDEIEVSAKWKAHQHQDIAQAIEETTQEIQQTVSEIKDAVVDAQAEAQKTLDAIKDATAQ